jgi:hypothetical protein
MKIVCTILLLDININFKQLLMNSKQVMVKNYIVPSRKAIEIFADLCF